MLCSSCSNKDATVHWTQVVGDKIHKVDLCEECAKTKGLDDPAGKALAGMLMGVDEEKDDEEKPQVELPEALTESGKDVICGNCGFTQEDFKKNMRFGCSQCYEEFNPQLQELVKTMHRGVKHQGKVPKNFAHFQGLADKMSELQEKLDDAISREAFEEAASLRDEIKDLKLQA